MRVVIEAGDLPGAAWADKVAIHVALQVGKEPLDPVPGDAPAASWATEVRRVDDDVRGPAVHGRRGERFLYLTWGEVEGGEFRMFRRAKLMLDGLPDADEVVGRVSLTDARGGPACARVPVAWEVSRARGRPARPGG